MSQRMTAGQLRREYLLRIIRHSVNGRGLNCKGGLSFNDDLKQLVADGKVVISRIYGMGRSQLTASKRPKRGARGLRRMTWVEPSDGVYNTSLFECPCCGSRSPDAWLVKHALNCSLRTDHYLDSHQLSKRSEPWHNRYWMGKPNRP
jgi:hypothetical protein